MSIRILVLALLAAALSACGDRVRSEVRTVHSLEGGGLAPGETVAVVAGEARKQGTLEFAAHAEKLSRRLRALGLRVVDPAGNPDYLVVFDYAIEEGAPVTRSYSVPRYGQTGVAPAYSAGPAGGHGGAPVYLPTYGVTGYATHSYSEAVYARSLTLALHRNDGAPAPDTPPIAETTVTSAGDCGRLAPVIDAMLTAAFTDFPGPSGQSRTIDVPFEGDC